MITSLGEEGAGYVLLMHLFVYFALVSFCLVFSSWCRGLAAVCDSGTPWTFLLTFFFVLFCFLFFCFVFSFLYLYK